MSIQLYSFLDDFKSSNLIGGAEKQQFLLINELIRRKHEVLICTNTKKLKKTEGYNLCHYPVERKYLKYLLIFINLIRFNPDVVYLRSPSNIGAILTVYTLLFRKKMTFFSAHDTDFNPEFNLQNYNKFLFFIFVKLTDIIFCQNTKQLQLLEIHYKKKGHIFGNMIHIEEQKTLLPRGKRNYFLWVARIEPFKRIELLFEIAKKLPEEQFVVIAPCNEKNEYSEKILDQINEITNIKYLSFVKPENIAEYYAYAKGFICTSKHEGFPNTYLEALNYGVPLYTLGVDPDNIIKKSNMKLGYVFSKVDDLVENIFSTINHCNTYSMHEYLSKYHSLEKNVERFLHFVSSPSSL